MRLACGPLTSEVRLEGGRASIDGREVAFREVRRSSGSLEGIEIAGDVVAVRTARDGDRVFVWCGGGVFEFRTSTAAPARAETDLGAGLVSPMPGRIRKVLVAEGDAVTRGQALLVLEAMKMEHSIRSPRDGRVAKVGFREGDLVEAGAKLAEIAVEGGESEERGESERLGP